MQAAIKSCVDSCAQYINNKQQLDDLKKATEAERKKYIADNGPMTVEKRSNTNITQPTPTVSDFKDLVSVENFDATYYQFSIESFGWYNIDVLVKGQNGVEESTLMVRLKGEWRERVNLYLVIPGMKIILPGGPAQEKNQYAFYEKNAIINLPQETDAYILAFSEAKEKIAFTIEKFTTNRAQTIDVSLTESTKEQFTSALNIFEGIQINVAPSANAANIRLTDEKLTSISKQLVEIEKLKPVNCDCYCGLEGPVTLPIELREQ